MIANVNSVNLNATSVKPNKPKIQVQFGNAEIELAKSLSETTKIAPKVIEKVKETAGSFLQPRKNGGEDDTCSLPVVPIGGTKLGEDKDKCCISYAFPFTYTGNQNPATSTPSATITGVTTQTACSGAGSNLVSNIALFGVVAHLFKKFFTGN